MNTIPEVPKGKELIWAEAVYKEPIEGVPFSNAGMSLGKAFTVAEGDSEAMQKKLDKLVERAVESYYEKLAQEVRSSRNDLIDKVRVEIAGEYDAKLDLAKDMIKELREENKKLKAN